MKGFSIKPEDDLEDAILHIITSYQAIIPEDIWFELGESKQFSSVISHAEVNETLSRLERRKLIRKGKDDKWRLA